MGIGRLVLGNRTKVIGNGARGMERGAKRDKTRHMVAHPPGEPLQGFWSSLAVPRSLEKFGQDVKDYPPRDQKDDNDQSSHPGQSGLHYFFSAEVRRQT